MEITAKMVSELRARTSAGIMDCKKAPDGDGGGFRRSDSTAARKGIEGLGTQRWARHV